MCVGHISTLTALIGRGEEGRKDLPWSLKLYGALEDIKQRKSLSLQLQFTHAAEGWFRGTFQQTQKAIWWDKGHWPSSLCLFIA